MVRAVRGAMGQRVSMGDGASGREHMLSCSAVPHRRCRFFATDAHHQVNMEVTCEFVQDKLCGDNQNEIRLTLKRTLADAPPMNDE